MKYRMTVDYEKRCYCVTFDYDQERSVTTFALTAKLTEMEEKFAPPFKTGEHYHRGIRLERVLDAEPGVEVVEEVYSTGSLACVRVIPGDD